MALARWDTTIIVRRKGRWPFGLSAFVGLLSERGDAVAKWRRIKSNLMWDRRHAGRDRGEEDRSRGTKKHGTLMEGNAC